MVAAFDIPLDPSAAGSGELPYHVVVDGFAADHFRVHSFTGHEAISEAYSFEIVTTAPGGGDDEIERTALGRRAMFTWRVGQTSRAFQGVIAAVRLAGVHEASGVMQYHLRLVPRLWLLKRRRRTRIFQRRRVPDIVTAVLLEAGIATRWQLTRDYPVREYCTQYEESDYRFVTRLLAEAGIYFYFAQGPAPDAAAEAVAAAISSAGSVASSAVRALAESAAGSVVESIASAVSPLLPGDTVICGDDATFYPPIGGDDAAELAAASAAALAPEVGAALGGLDPVGGAVPGGASALAGAAIAAFASRSAPKLYFLPLSGTATPRLDKITRFTLRNSVRSKLASYRDYDPERPMVLLNSTAVSSAPFPPSPLEAAAAAASAAANLAAAVAPGAAGGAVAMLSSATGAAESALGGPASSLETYEHHGPFLFPKWSFANDEAPRILRQKRRRASVAEGESGCPDLGPGHRFALTDHPAAHLDRLYVVTSVAHRGQAYPAPGAPAWEVYANTFECAPAEVTYIPPRPKRRSVQVALTTTVVGPPGEEIHVDAAGQIRVQFHWDRDGKYDENSSCWIRTMHPWGGAGWGVQFIPRVGMEVVVVFEGGDPDKPMVLGALYNGTHPPPFVLPGDKTRSGFRTQSSPGGSGFNEISFEDAAAREQIYIHAQRNLDEVVERNHTALVRNDEFIRIIGNRLDKIEQNLEQHIRGNHSCEVGGNRIDVVAGNADERISGARVVRVEGNARQSVQGTTDLEHVGDLTTRVEGSMTTVVGQHDKRRSWTTHAEGTVTLSSVDLAKVSSDKELVLSVGTSLLRITPDRIELQAPGISVKGAGAGLGVEGDKLALSSKGDAQVVVGKKLVLKTDGASLAMEKEVKVDGQKILLNSPEQAKDPPPKDPKPPTIIELADKDGNPLPHQRFVIALDDGTEVAGVTDGEGKAEVALEGGGKVLFPGLKEAKPA